MLEDVQAVDLVVDGHLGGYGLQLVDDVADGLASARVPVVDGLHVGHDPPRLPRAQYGKRPCAARNQPRVASGMANRMYGDGAIYRRSVDGRWYGALDVGAGTGRRRRATVSGTSREAVELRLDQLRRRRRSAADEMTVADWLRQWRDELLPGTVAAQGTLDNYAWAIDCHLIPGLGTVLLADLSPADVAVFLHHKLQAGVRLEDVVDVMGHRSTRTTSAVYRHVVVPTISAGQRPAERLFA